MSDWGPSVYGDPCRECGFAWSTPVPEAIALVAILPVAFGGLLEGSVGTEQRPDLNWSVTGYVLHVSDNLRIWAERLMGVLGGAPLLVGNSTTTNWPKLAATGRSRCRRQCGHSLDP